MKQIFYLLCSAAMLSSCANKNTPANEFKNREIAALMQVDQTFNKLSKIVDSMSAGLSETEQQRAAYFLVSAYSLAVQAYLERGNPAAPMFTEWMAPPRKFGGDNPYTIYSQAPLEDKFSYKIIGQKGNGIYLGFQLYGFAEGFNLATNNLGLKDIIFNPDGTFEIYVSQTKPEGAKNWVQMTPGDHAILVRQYFDRRTGNVPCRLAIERTENNPDTGYSYLERIGRTNSMLNEMIMGVIEVNRLLRETAFNKYSSKDAQVRAPKYGGALYPTKDNIYEGCWVSLEPGQAMKVHGRLPKNTLYASYVFYDRWYNTPNYPEVNCFRTMDEIVLNPDSTFDLYISPEKIDNPNWINTGGLYEGSFSSRYMQSTETEFPSIEIVDIEDIKPVN